LILSIVLAVLALPLVVLCVGLLCPLGYAADCHNKNARFSVKWLFGILSFKCVYKNGKLMFGLFIFGRQRAKPAAKSGGQKSDTKQKKPAAKKRREKKPKKSPKKEPEKKNPISYVLQVFNHPDIKIIINKTILLLKRLLKRIKPHTFRLDGTVGFDRSDITGRLLAFQALFTTFTGLDAAVRGDFSGRRFDISFKMRGGFNLFSLAWPLMIYVFSKPIRKIIWGYFKNNKGAENE